MKKLISKIALGIITLSLSISINASVYVAHADEPSKELSDATFDVGEVLKLEGDKQDQAYFKVDENDPYNGLPPIIRFILTVLDFATAIMGSLALILLIIGGFRFMIAQGNQQKIDEAKDMIKFVIIGLIVTFLSYTITIFVQSIFIPE